MIQAGILRDVIDIQKPVEIQDSSGAMDTAFETIYSEVRANVYPLSGNEYVSAQQIVAGVTTRITIRRLPNIDPTCRIVRSLYDDSPVTIEIYDIQAVLPDAVSGKRYLTLMCAQRFAEGWRRGDE